MKRKRSELRVLPLVGTEVPSQNLKMKQYVVRSILKMLIGCTISEHIPERIRSTPRRWPTAVTVMPESSAQSMLQFHGVDMYTGEEQMNPNV